MSRRGNIRKRAAQKKRHLKRQADAKKAPALSRGLITYNTLSPLARAIVDLSKT
jgi:hypothetical protein